MSRKRKPLKKQYFNDTFYSLKAEVSELMKTDISAAEKRIGEIAQDDAILAREIGEKAGFYTP